MPLGDVPLAPVLGDPKLDDPKLDDPKLLAPALPLVPAPPEFGWPVTAFCPKLLADCELTPPPVTFTPCLSISMFGSYQNSHVS